MTAIAHLLTGEVLPDDLAVLQDLEASVDRYLRGQSKHYKFRGELRERIAELHGQADLPPPRWRSPLQQKVAECPRCGVSA